VSGDGGFVLLHVHAIDVNAVHLLTGSAEQSMTAGRTTPSSSGKFATDIGPEVNDDSLNRVAMQVKGPVIHSFGLPKQIGGRREQRNFLIQPAI